MIKHSFRACGRIRLLPLAPLALALSASLPAGALTIAPTFAGAFAVPQTAEISSAIDFYQTAFTDNVAVTIKFVDCSSDPNCLGQSSQNFYNVNYQTFLNALHADASSPSDTVALASLPAPTPGGQVPVPGTDANTFITLTRANAAAVGLTVGTPGDGITNWDATISLNLSLMGTDHANPGLTPSLYDLRSVAMHEINEVLGTVSNLKYFFDAGAPENAVGPIDLFRYTASGARTFTPSGDDAYFSIDGGVTQLARFNQNAGGDYADFWSFDGGNVYQIQDAFSSPGKSADMGVEATMLDVVGYSVAAVPEPQTYALMLAGLGLLGLVARRRKG